MKKVLIIAVAAVSLSLIAYAYYEYNRPNATLTKATPDFRIAAAALFADFESDEPTAEAKYLNKIIAVTGTVQEVTTSQEGSISITLESGGELGGVICELDAQVPHPRTNFKIGETITLKGICTGMLMDVVLVRCVEAGKNE